MVKKIIAYLFIIILAVFLCAFLLVYSFQGNIIFSIFKPMEQVFKKEMRLYCYNQEEEAINNVFLRIYYCLPSDDRDFSIENWQQVLSEAAKEVKDFYQLQFGYNMEMDFRIYPQVIYLNNKAQYFIDLVVQDFIEEMAIPHSESQSIKALMNEVSGKTNEQAEWTLAAEEIDGSYVVNLFVLGIDINALEVDSLKVLGLNNEKSSSLVFTTGFIADSFNDFYSSVAAHEIGHALGIPRLNIDPETKLELYTMMGGEPTRKLRDNYLKEDIRENMGMRLQ